MASDNNFYTYTFYLLSYSYLILLQKAAAVWLMKNGGANLESNSFQSQISKHYSKTKKFRKNDVSCYYLLVSKESHINILSFSNIQQNST